MEVQKRLYDTVRDQLATQLHRVTLEGVLGAVGLQLLKRGRGATLPIVAAFGAGVAVGAGAGLLLAPMSGSELRGKIGELLKKLPFLGGRTAGRDASLEAPDQDAEEPSGANGGRRSRHAGGDGATA